MAKTTQRMEKLAQEIHKEGHKAALLEMRQWIDQKMGKVSKFPCHYCGRMLKSAQGKAKHEKSCSMRPAHERGMDPAEPGGDHSVSIKMKNPQPQPVSSGTGAH